MSKKVKIGNVLTLQTDWEIGNGGPDTATIPQGMDFEITAIKDEVIELTCCNDDYPYDSFKMDITFDDLEDFSCESNS